MFRMTGGRRYPHASGDRAHLEVIQVVCLVLQVFGLLPERHTLLAVARAARQHQEVLRHRRRAVGGGARGAGEQPNLVERRVALTVEVLHGEHAAAVRQLHWLAEVRVREKHGRGVREHLGLAAVLAPRRRPEKQRHGGFVAHVRRD
jgi:hypothetical protein